MSDLRTELAQEAAGLEAASNAAMTSLGLAPDEFAWFTGETRQPMQPQPMPPESDVEVDFFMSMATFYGGRIANKLGDFACGHIRADISEHIPEGVMHQAGWGQSPVPYIPRLLSVKNKIITVDTPTVSLSLNDGPVVIEGIGRNSRFRKTTLYNTETGDVTVKSGEFITNDYGDDDRTVEHDAFKLPNDILLPRLATVIRTIKSVSSMFDQIAWRNVHNVSWEITEEPPRW